MKMLLDTSFLYALNDAQDQNHLRTVNFLSTLQAELYLPTPVLPELCYLLHSRLGHKAMRRFLSGLPDSDIELIPIEATDLPRVTELLTNYADAGLDFVDAVLVVMAERLGIEDILTFDRRDFALIRPRHCSAFNLHP
jgi:predicted nucleic acid-binding protein